MKRPIPFPYLVCALSVLLQSPVAAAHLQVEANGLRTEIRIDTAWPSWANSPNRAAHAVEQALLEQAVQYVLHHPEVVLQAETSVDLAAWWQELGIKLRPSKFKNLILAMVLEADFPALPPCPKPLSQLPTFSAKFLGAAKPLSTQIAFWQQATDGKK